jgi:hypothetical protein
MREPNVMSLNDFDVSEPESWNDEPRFASGTRKIERVPPPSEGMRSEEVAEIDGKLRSLSMIQFLERATEELERASLETKSFVPKLVQSVDEAAL